MPTAHFGDGMGLPEEPVQDAASGRSQGLLRGQDRPLLCLARLLHKPPDPAQRGWSVHLPLRPLYMGR